MKKVTISPIAVQDGPYFAKYFSELCKVLGIYEIENIHKIIFLND